MKYSDVLFFYTDLINNQELQINTLETINTVLRPTFQLAVRDDIIRKNLVDGAYCEVKKRNGGARKTRRALTVDQQRIFMEYVVKNPFFYHWYPFFVFLLGTGCRIGEAIGIRWDDIDLENGFMTGGIKTAAGAGRISQGGRAEAGVPAGGVRRRAL